MSKTKKEGTSKSIFTFIILIAVGLLLGYGMLGTSIKVEDDYLKITGLHSQKILYSEMDSIKLKENLPNITAKTGGFSMAGKRLGSFTTDEYGKIKLFLFNNSSPFIYIEKTDGNMVILNDKESSMTEELFKDISNR